MAPLWSPFNCCAFPAFLSYVWEIWGLALLLQMALAGTWSIKKVVCCPSNHCQVNWKTVQFKADLQYTSCSMQRWAQTNTERIFVLTDPPRWISTFVSNAVVSWILNLFSLTFINNPDINLISGRTLMLSIWTVIGLRKTDPDDFEGSYSPGFPSSHQRKRRKNKINIKT